MIYFSFLANTKKNNDKKSLEIIIKYITLIIFFMGKVIKLKKLSSHLILNSALNNDALNILKMGFGIQKKTGIGDP